MSPANRASLNKQLIRLADGDRNAFDSIYEAAWPIASRFASRMVQGSVEAEDVAQQALLKVFHRISEFDRTKDALSWILGITAFECKTARQKIKRRRENFNSEDVLVEKSDHQASAEEQLVSKSIEDGIQAALAGLSIQDQDTIKIAIFEMDRPEIPAATFRKRLERAFDRLREKWRDEYE